MRVAETSLPLPPSVTVAVALRTTTERLAQELANPQRATPEWSPFEWRAARAVAAMHGISGLLAGRLLWVGARGWREFLVAQREHIARRNARLREFLGTVAERFQSQGIPVQALKGAALWPLGLYTEGERPMADLDLLVRVQDTRHAGDILEDLGLRESHRTVKHRVFEAREGTVAPFGEHADNRMKVELHERICEPLPHRLTDISHLVLPRDAHPGLNPYPSRAALMAHLLLHAGGGMAYRTLRLIQLHDIALLAHRMTQQDWRELQDWTPWWAWPPLALAQRYYGAIAPQTVMASTRAYCQPVLRRTCARQRLSDVSLSHLWLEAFPGIEWARSIGEALTFAARRVVPSGEVLSDRKFAVRTDPSLAVGDWGALSQGRRIIRALSRRTARPWPLHNVRAALAQPR